MYQREIVLQFSFLTYGYLLLRHLPIRFQYTKFLYHLKCHLKEKLLFDAAHAFLGRGEIPLI